jgi:hypothetical protein
MPRARAGLLTPAPELRLAHRRSSIMNRAF